MDGDSAMIDDEGELTELAGELIDRLAARDWRLATAESCTAGRLASLIAAAPGAGSTLEAGFVVYTKRAKAEILGLDAALLSTPYGAVTPQVAQAMAVQAMTRAKVEIGIAVTGVLGPKCDEDDNPVGAVELACATGELVLQRRLELPEGPPERLRAATMRAVLLLACETVDRREAEPN